MDPSSSRIIGRTALLQKRLEDLKREIENSNRYLNQVEVKSIQLIENLKVESSTQAFLKKYCKINNTLSHYINVVTEINCELEILNDEDDATLDFLCTAETKHESSNSSVLNSSLDNDGQTTAKTIYHFSAPPTNNAAQPSCNNMKKSPVSPNSSKTATDEITTEKTKTATEKIKTAPPMPDSKEEKESETNGEKPALNNQEEMIELPKNSNSNSVQSEEESSDRSSKTLVNSTVVVKDEKATYVETKSVNKNYNVDPRTWTEAPPFVPKQPANMNFQGRPDMINQYYMPAQRVSQPYMPPYMPTYVANRFQFNSYFNPGPPHAPQAPPMPPQMPPQMQTQMNWYPPGYSPRPQFNRLSGSPITISSPPPQVPHPVTVAAAAATAITTTASAKPTTTPTLTTTTTTATTVTTVPVTQSQKTIDESATKMLQSLQIKESSTTKASANSSKKVSCQESVVKKSFETPSPEIQTVQESLGLPITYIKPMDFSREPGTKYSVTYCGMVSPSEYYVQVYCQSLRSMSDMNKEIKKQFESAPDVQFYHLNAENQTCKSAAKRQLGKYAMCHIKENKRWDRVMITDWRDTFDDDAVRVFFVDYGDFKTISLKYIQPMDQRFAAYPRFVQRCHLYGIRPKEAEDGENVTDWSDAAVTMFSLIMESVKNGDDCRVVVCPKDGHHPEDSLSTKLYTLDDEKSINEKMVQFESAISTVNTTPPPAKSPVDVQKKLVTWSKADEDISGVVAEKEKPVKNIPYELEVPPAIGSIFPVQVTCLLHVTRFYCTLDKSEDDMVDKNEELTLEINAGNGKSLAPLTVPPDAGDIVIGKYAEDGNWYRAKVVEADVDNDSFKVLFLDYGNKQTMPLHNLRQMEMRFANYPIQLIKCHLNNIQPNPETDIQYSLNYLQSRVEEGGLSVKIVEVLKGEEPTFKVDLYDKNGLDIGKQMIAENLVKLVK